MDSAYWVFNLVSNLSSLRYKKMIIDITNAQEELEKLFHEYSSVIDKKAVELTDNEELRNFLSIQSTQLSEIMMKRWIDLSRFLIVKYTPMMN